MISANPPDPSYSWMVVDTVQVQFRTFIAEQSSKNVTLAVAKRSIQEVTLQAFNDFVKSIQDIPTVEQVSVHPAGSYAHLITYVSHSSEEERFAVYQAELAIVDKYPDLEFEFDLVDRRGYPTEDIEVEGERVAFIHQLPDTETNDTDNEDSES